MLFLFALRVAFTDTNWYEYMGNSSTSPVIAMCFAQFCGHCRRALPSFQEFADSAPLTVGIMNCTEFSEFCDNNLSIHAYPTFLVKSHFGVDRVRIRPQPDTYQRLVDRLYQLENGSLLAPWTGHPTHFPTILFRFNPNDNENISIAQRAVLKVNLVLNLTFAIEYDSSLTEPQIVAHVDEEIVKTAPFDPLNIKSFCEEHGHAIFGPWSMFSLSGVTRLFVFIVNTDNDVITSFLPLAKEYYDKAQFGAANPGFPLADAVSTFKLSQEELPAAVILNLETYAHSNIPNATPDKVRETLERVIAEDETVVFTKIGRSSSSLISDRVLYMIAMIMIGVCCLTLVILFVTLAIFYYCEKKPIKTD